MRKIASNCTKLTQLDISCSYEIYGQCIEIVGMNCKNIHTLKRNLMQTWEIARLTNCIYVQGLCFETLGNVDSFAIRRYMSSEACTWNFDSPHWLIKLLVFFVKSVWIWSIWTCSDVATWLAMVLQTVPRTWGIWRISRNQILQRDY